MTIKQMNSNKFAYCKGAPPPKDVLQSFGAVLSENAKAPWLIVLIEGKYMAKPINGPHISGVHPEGMDVETLLDSLKAYFNRTKSPGYDYGDFEIWAEKPARDLPRSCWPEPDITGEGTPAKAFDEALALIKNRGLEKAYIRMDKKGVGYLPQKFIQEFLG